VDRLEFSRGDVHPVPLLAAVIFSRRRTITSGGISGPQGRWCVYVADITGRSSEHPDYLPEEIASTTDFETGKTQGASGGSTGKTAAHRLATGPHIATSSRR